MPSKARVAWRKNRSNYDFAVVVKGFGTQLHVKLPSKKRQQDERDEFCTIFTLKPEVMFHRFHNTMTHKEIRTLAVMLQQAAAEIAFWEAEWEDKDDEYVP